MNKFTAIKSIVFGVLVWIISSTSCKKDTLETTTAKADTNVVRELLTQIQPEQQTFIIDASQPNTLTGKDGMVIEIPANAFINNKDSLVSGNVTIILQEILSVGGQITSGIPATSNKKILKSAGEFLFRAVAGGEQLNIAPNRSIIFNIPATDVDSTMNTFIANDYFLGITGEDFNWFQADSVLFTAKHVDTVAWDSIKKEWNFDTTYANAHDLQYKSGKYKMTISDLYTHSMFNVDRFINWGSTTWAQSVSCVINAPESSNGEPIDFTLKLVFKQFGATSWFDHKGLLGTTATIIVDDEWPVGEDVVVLVVGVGQKSKKTYFGKTTLNITADSKPVIDISPLSTDELSTALGNL